MITIIHISTIMGLFIDIYINICVYTYVAVIVFSISPSIITTIDLACLRNDDPTPEGPAVEIGWTLGALSACWRLEEGSLASLFYLLVLREGMREYDPYIIPIYYVPFFLTRN